MDLFNTVIEGEEESRKVMANAGISEDLANKVIDIFKDNIEVYADEAIAGSFDEYESAKDIPQDVLDDLDNNLSGTQVSVTLNKDDWKDEDGNSYSEVWLGDSRYYGGETNLNDCGDLFTQEEESALENLARSLEMVATIKLTDNVLEAILGIDDDDDEYDDDEYDDEETSKEDLEEAKEESLASMPHADEKATYGGIDWKGMTNKEVLSKWLDIIINDFGDSDMLKVNSYETYSKLDEFDQQEYMMLFEENIKRLVA